MEQEITLYEELNAEQHTTQEEIIERYSVRIEEAEKEINNTRRDIDDAFYTLKDESTKAAYDKGLGHGYNLAKRHLKEEERQKLEKSDKEIAEFCAVVITIAAIEIAIALIVTGIGFL